MTTHLRHLDFVEALDHALDASRRAHLTGCAACQAELASLRAALSDAEHVEAPAPSPLFWEHFSERVRQATAAEPILTPSTLWRRWWRPVGVLAGAVGAVVVVAVLRSGPPASTVNPVPEGVQAVNAVAAADDGSWGLVIGLASELDWADVREVAKPAEGTADAMIGELTAAQRDELVRLLHEEIGGW